MNPSILYVFSSMIYLMNTVLLRLHCDDNSGIWFFRLQCIQKTDILESAFLSKISVFHKCSDSFTSNGLLPSFISNVNANLYILRILAQFQMQRAHAYGMQALFRCFGIAFYSTLSFTVMLSSVWISALPS